MARVTVEDCLEQEENRFALVLLAANRTRQLMKGGQPLVRGDGSGRRPRRLGRGVRRRPGGGRYHAAEAACGDDERASAPAADAVRSPAGMEDRHADLSFGLRSRPAADVKAPLQRAPLKHGA